MDTKVHNADHVDKTNGSVPLGSVMHDTAKITGAFERVRRPSRSRSPSTPTPSATGTGTSVTNTGADEGDATAVRSAASAALGAGGYSYNGSVAGNDNYLGDDSDCESQTMSPLWSPGYAYRSASHVASPPR